MTIAGADNTQAMPASDDGGDKPRLGWPIAAGFLVLVAFFGGFGGWVALAPLESAAIAPGIVKVDTSRKVIQHLEGGIIAEILVRDGDLVEAGQALVVLDNTRAASSLALLEGRYRAAVVQTARLVAERDDAGEIAFPGWLLAETGDPETAEAIEGQRRILAERRKALSGQIDILKKRVGQFREEIVGLRGQIVAEKKQSQLIARELVDMRILREKLLVPKFRVLQLERRAAEIQGRTSLNVAAIARAKQAIGEAELRMQQILTTARNEAVADLRAAQNEMFELEERLTAAKDVARRTVIEAPLQGIVVGLRVHTSGGVIAPGATLLEIVPSGDSLVVEAKVSPGDIDVVHVGLAANVRLTAFSTRAFVPVEGRVTHVSADHLVDEATGLTYFQARIVLDAASLRDALDGSPIYPGMQAEVMIITGEHTTLDYLLLPLTRSFNRALRES